MLKEEIIKEKDKLKHSFEISFNYLLLQYSQYYSLLNQQGIPCIGFSLLTLFLGCGVEDC